MDWKNWMLVFCLTSLGNLTWAQGCPSGIPSAGNPSCIPPDQQHSPYYQGNQAPAPQIPKVRWATRWGAIAIDDTNSGVGVVTGMTSKKKAEKAAMTKCRAKGGGGCRVEIAYGNQCGVIAWGNNHYSTASETTINKASEIAVELCSKYTENCRIYYADCSMPERIQ